MFYKLYLAVWGAIGIIGVARILSEGVHFFQKKVDDLFLVLGLKITSKYTSNLSHPA